MIDSHSHDLESKLFQNRIDKILQSYINQSYQSIAQIQSELVETTQICRDTIDKLLIREDELIEIIEKT